MENGDYKDLPKEQRRHMLSAFRAFIQHLPIRYLCLQYQMSEFAGNQKRSRGENEARPHS